jgi:hypothetical protein
LEIRSVAWFFGQGCLSGHLTVASAAAIIVEGLQVSTSSFSAQYPALGKQRSQSLDQLFP